MLLVAGADLAALYTPTGVAVAAWDLPDAPVKPLIPADFNGDGFVDIIAVADGAVFGYVQVMRPGGVGFTSLLACIGVAMVVVYINY